MTSPSGFARNSAATQAQKAVAIQNVDLLGLKAYAYTREESGIEIDLRYHAGAVHCIPSTGDQWIVRRFANTWILVSQLPYNGTELLTIADAPQQGMTQVGSTNPSGLGPTYLNGSVVIATAPFRVPAVATSDRPNPAPAGTHVFDSTLDKPIWSTGSGWVDGTGATV